MIISDPTFPFDYDDITQFDVCLSPQTVKDNLAAITDKVLQEDYLSIVLSKLREVRDRETGQNGFFQNVCFALGDNA